MLRPLNDFIIVKRAEHEGKVGSIIIPDTAQEKLTRGVVMRVGPGALQPSKLADRLEAVASMFEKDVEKVELSSAEVQSCADEVREVAAALRRRAPTVKKGDDVLFGKYSGNEAKIKDENGEEHDCVLMREDDIYGVVEE